MKKVSDEAAPAVPGRLSRAVTRWRANRHRCEAKLRETNLAGCLPIGPTVLAVMPIELQNHGLELLPSTRTFWYPQRHLRHREVVDQKNASLDFGQWCRRR